MRYLHHNYYNLIGKNKNKNYIVIGVKIEAGGVASPLEMTDL